MEILGKILGSEARVKIMRLFLQNRSVGFTSKDVARRSRVTSPTGRRELKLLYLVGFIKKRAGSSQEWYFNSSFKYAKEFEDLLIRSDNFSKQNVLDNIKKAGQMKLVIVSGIFTKNDDCKVDLLVVGDKMKQGIIDEGIRKLEALIGSELVYATFDTKEFLYRLNMYDKLVRDILDYPHEVLFATKELSTHVLKKK